MLFFSTRFLFFVCNLYFTVLTPRTPISLTYKLDYGYCFVNKIYRKNFKIINKSANRYSRFQWNVHPNIVFTPSIGHLQPMTCKEIIATFFSSEPVHYIDVINKFKFCQLLLINIFNLYLYDNNIHYSIVYYVPFSF